VTASRSADTVRKIYQIKNILKVLRGLIIINDDDIKKVSTADSHQNGRPNFIDRIKKECKNNERLRDWAYTIGIFLLVSGILTLPFIIIMPLEGLLLLILMIIIGFVVALFTAYILTPFGLRHFKEYTEDQKIQRFIEDLSIQAQIPTPKLLVTETLEINAMAFNSLFGGRVCLTRGILDAYHRGDMSDDELKAIIGHEIGHLVHGDCFKWAFVLSWLSIFDLMGTLMLVIGSAFIAAGSAMSVFSRRDDNPGPFIALMGFVLVIGGIIQRLICKIASIPALHMSRSHELAADQTGAQLTSPDTCISALRKIELINNQLIAEKLAQLPFSDRWQAAPRNVSWIDGLFSTHPSFDQRVLTLEQLPKKQVQVPAEPQLPIAPLPEEYELFEPAPISELLTNQPVADLTVSSTSPTVAVPSRTVEKYSDMNARPIPEPEITAVPTPPVSAKKFSKNKKVLSAFALIGIVLVGSFIFIPPLMLATPNFFATPLSDDQGFSPSPGYQQSPTPFTPAPTSLQTTQVTPMPTPLVLGQIATVALPYSESLEFNHNTIHRYFTSPNTVTLMYVVTPQEVTEVKEISSPSGYYTKTVTRNDPNAYLVITIRDVQTGNVIDKTGFGRTYSSSPNQKIIIRKTGDMEVEMTGAKVFVDLTIK
jgi:heat shock protein HtpX